MLTSILITDFNTAFCASQSHCPQTAWISAVDPSYYKKTQEMQHNFSSKNIPHLTQYFYDWMEEDNDIFILRHLEEKGPRTDNIHRILSFLLPLVHSKKPHALGINCVSGISRSSAIGLIAWVLQGKSPQAALQKVLTINPHALPNLRILRLASPLLNKDLLEALTAYEAPQNKRFSSWQDLISQKST